MANISGSNFKALNADEWVDFFANHIDLKHYTSILERPGNFVLMSAVEYYHFPPRTSSNDNFHVNIVKWGDARWNIFSAPSASHDDIIRTADALAMRICKNPPAMMSFGESAMVMTVPPTSTEKEVKALLSNHGVPEALISSFSKLEPFPGGGLKTTHAIENNPDKLTKPLSPTEFAEIRKREAEINEVLESGVRPSLAEIADYVYGAGRVRHSARPS